MPLRVWDEARLANNALEMLLNGNYLVAHFNDAPEMWNTKPPLMLWLQVVSFKIFGINEFSSRFPAALSGFLTILSLVYFSKKELNNTILGLISGLVLVTSVGFVCEHVTRTGDYDALLTLWTTLYAFSFFRFIHAETTKDKRQFLLLTILCITLATLTKGIAGLMALPSLFIYTIYQKKLLHTLKNKWLYIGITFFLVVIGGFYLLRESYNPGFLQAVYDNELGGRFNNSQESHGAPFLFYIKQIWNYKWGAWLFFLPLGASFAWKNEKLWQVFLYSSCVALTFLLIISISKTKIQWYDAPIYPFLALIAGIGVYGLLELCYLHSYKLMTVFLFLAIFAIPYTTILSKVYKPKEKIEDLQKYGVSIYLQWQMKANTKPKLAIAHYGYDAQIRFYWRALNLKGAKISMISPEKLTPRHTVVITDQKKAKDYIEKNYSYKIQQDNLGFNNIKKRDRILNRYFLDYYNLKNHNGVTTYNIHWE